MSQVPQILTQKLAELRRRERLLHLLWGVARAVSVVLGLLLLACLVDWTYDLWDDTPWGLRRFMSIGLIVVGVLALLIFVVLPQLRRLRDERLALWVEDRWPALQHRLISALQLNRGDARTQGMSPDMIAAATDEAVEQVRPIDFTSVADHRRVKRSAWVLVPVVLLALVLFLLSPSVALALLRRQALQDVDIPRSVSVVSVDTGIWPSAEEIPLRFEVLGPGAGQSHVGSVRIQETGDDGRSFRVPLTLESAGGNDKAVYVAKVPAGNVDFTYKAKIMDGRSRSAGNVTYAARPVVTEQRASVILPDFVGLSPEEWAGGKRTHYEQDQPRGDIVVNCGGTARARVAIKTDKPIQRAVLELHGSAYPDLSGKSGLTRAHDQRAKAITTLNAAIMRPTFVSGPLAALSSANAVGGTLRTRPAMEQKFPQLVQEATWEFDVRPTETSYRIVVFDIHGFASKTETVRSIKIEAEPLPTVVLHRERWDPRAEYTSKSKTPEILDYEGLPLPLVDGVSPGPLRFSYEAHGPYGIGRVQLKVGVIRGSSESEDPKNPKLERWVTLPLDEVPPSKRKFERNKGAFSDSTEEEWRIPFYPEPSTVPDIRWPRIFAGGRYEYRPAGILDDEGQPFVFKTGDQVAVYVEVFNCNPDPEKALMAKSRLREKEVVSLDVFGRWLSDTLQEASRIEALMYLQQQVYDRPWFSIFGFGK